MSATTPVREVMTSEVLTFRDTDDVRTAMRDLAAQGHDGAPVLDEAGGVVGVISTGDLIVRQSKLHFPTVVSILGASLELKSKGFDEDLEKALGSTVGEVMNAPAITCAPDDTVERAATLMHEHKVSRLPVIEDGRIVGIVSRSDLLRGALAGDD